jgi:hypothetical protein
MRGRELIGQVGKVMVQGGGTWVQWRSFLIFQLILRILSDLAPSWELALLSGADVNVVDSFMQPKCLAFAIALPANISRIECSQAFKCWSRHYEDMAFHLPLMLEIRQTESQLECTQAPFDPPA